MSVGDCIDMLGFTIDLHVVIMQMFLSKDNNVFILFYAIMKRMSFP